MNLFYIESIVYCLIVYKNLFCNSYGLVKIISFGLGDGNSDESNMELKKKEKEKRLLKHWASLESLENICTLAFLCHLFVSFEVCKWI